MELSTLEIIFISITVLIFLFIGYLIYYGSSTQKKNPVSKYKVFDYSKVPRTKK